MQMHVIIRSLEIDALIAAAISLLLLIRDLFLVLFPVYERSLLSFWIGILTLVSCLVGSIIGLNALWQHWKIYRNDFFDFISLNLCLSLSPIFYIIIALLLF